MLVYNGMQLPFDIFQWGLNKPRSNYMHVRIIMHDYFTCEELDIRAPIPIPV